MKIKKNWTHHPVFWFFVGSFEAHQPKSGNNPSKSVFRHPPGASCAPCPANVLWLRPASARFVGDSEERSLLQLVVLEWVFPGCLLPHILTGIFFEGKNAWIQTHRLFFGCESSWNKFDSPKGESQTWAWDQVRWWISVERLCCWLNP